MGLVAEIIKIDAEILNVRKKLRAKERLHLRKRLDELVEKRAKLLKDLEKNPPRNSD